MDMPTGGQLVFLCLNFLFWTLTYAFTIHAQWKTKRAGFPSEAIALMAGFEVSYIYVFGITTDLGDFAGIASLFEDLWLVLDITIFVQVLRYGANQEFSATARERHVPLSWGRLFGAIFGITAFVALFELQKSGLFAFIDQALIAILFVPLVWRHKSMGGLSLPALWCRALADLCASIALLVFSPWCDITAADSVARCVTAEPMNGNWFIVWLSVVWVACDVAVLIHAMGLPKQAPLSLNGEAVSDLPALG